MERFVTIPVVYGSVTINQSVASVTASIPVSQRFHGGKNVHAIRFCGWFCDVNENVCKNLYAILFHGSRLVGSEVADR